MTIDEWFAEQCGVAKWYSTDDSLLYGFYHNNRQYGYKWSIHDPRCREIIREKFKIETVWDLFQYPNKWAAAYKEQLYGLGETIAEAEIACLQKIYEARDIGASA